MPRALLLPPVLCACQAEPRLVIRSEPPGALVTVTDQRGARELAPAAQALEGLPARFALGEHREEDFTRAALVGADPAVPSAHPLLRAARAAAD